MHIYMSITPRGLIQRIQNWKNGRINSYYKLIEEKKALEYTLITNSTNSPVLKKAVGTIFLHRL